MAGSELDIRTFSDKTLSLITGTGVKQLPDMKTRSDKIKVSSNQNAQALLQSRYMYTAKTYDCPYSFTTFRANSKRSKLSKNSDQENQNIEPIPFLAGYQERNQPSYIQKQNKIALLKATQRKSRPTASNVSSSRLTSYSKPNIGTYKSDSSVDLTAPRVSEYQHVVPNPPKHKRKTNFYRKTCKVRSITRVPLEHRSLEEIIASGLKDPFQIVEILRKNKEIGFFYLDSNADPSTNDYSFYNLKVIAFEDIDPNNYATISEMGVTKTYQDEVEFTNTEEWQRQYRLYQKMMTLKIYKFFRLRHAFSVWRSTVRRKLIGDCREALQKNLVFVNLFFGPCILKINKMRCEISSLSLLTIKSNHIYTMKEFCDDQINWLYIIQKKLLKFHVRIREIVKKVCSDIFLDAGFATEGFYYDPETRTFNEFIDGLEPKRSTVIKDLSDLATDPPEKMTFTEQSKKKSLCIAITHFIRLVDFLICNALHTMLFTSVSTLLDCFDQCIQTVPTFSAIYSWKKEVQLSKKEVFKPSEKIEQPTEAIKSSTFSLKTQESSIMESSTSLLDKPSVEVSHQCKPFFVIELHLDMDSLEFVPTVDEFGTSLENVITGFEDTVYAVESLLSDKYYSSFTFPIINNRREKKLCGNGPSLALEVAGDLSYLALTDDIRQCLNQGFESIDIYRETLQHFHELYYQNETLDIANMEIPEEDVLFFSQSLQLYNAQQDAISKVHVKREIGLFLVDARPFVDTFTPSPNNCLSVIFEILPVLARKKMDDVLFEIQDASFKLEIIPETTMEYARSLDFIEMFTNRLEQVQAAGINVVDLYVILEKYDIPFQGEDKAVFQSLEPSVVNVKMKLDKAIAERSTLLHLFDQSLQKEITELDKKIKDVKQKSQDPYILSGDSDRLFACSIITDVIDQANVLHDSTKEYQTHQQHFGLELTRFDELDEIRNEMKLKQLLWNSLIEWDELSKQWMDISFEDLDPEYMNNQVVKYLKNTHHLEKGLPPNDIVPLIKKNVLKIKEKMPVLTHLLNPNLKLRHWQKLQEIISQPLPQCLPVRDASQYVNMQQLYDWSVFEKLNAISEVSGQASGEAALEKMIKNVENSWKKTELIVLTYRDMRDVFILGGTDDIQTQLDDSRITIATIASSRYVEPIKEKVEEWQRDLNLMNDTLDAWLTFQSNWLYLEPIFTASDIQRQLPAEAKMFTAADKDFKETMRRVNKFPYALRFCTQPGLLEVFQKNNAILDHIHTCLEAYLETKRMVFPRFYFLSNDELIEIIAQSKNPQAVQPHLRKCFDAISSLEFAVASTAEVGNKKKIQYSNDILAMISPEGERVSLGKSLKARGNVEDWLGKVEDAMVLNLRKLTKYSLSDYMKQERETWCISHSSQVILTVSQTIWCEETTNCLSTHIARLADEMKSYEKSLFDQLNNLAALVRTDLSRLHRNVLTALITIDVHARDVITEMVKMSVHSPTSFEWLRQLRYYWDPQKDDCVVRCANSLYNYGYEYLGACPRLVITPLTDRCYLCLMGALQINLGGAPAGPAGTGKTETTKDLAKALAKQCVVFNCSEGLDYKMMGRFFSGLAQSGAWCCFDEFNRIDIEVLSVIAQQLLTIRNAKVTNATRFLFEGREIKLDKTCAAFVTMNPGYAGRTELPDNLKSLFRPIAMMVPDYKLIAEVILYSEGFESSKVLSQKMVQMYKLCSEQLSHQDHYDFGMRAVKSVLVMAGFLKRESPNIREDIVLIRALRDSNLPKFLTQDANLFCAILSDLFPGVDIPDSDYGIFEKNVQMILISNKLQPETAIVKKVVQLYETLIVRHGVMLVGPTGGGKTTIYSVLAQTLTKLNKEGSKSRYKSVTTTIMNPKSITMGELYGEANRLTLEWKDGLMGISVRNAVLDKSDDYKWIVCDGPVDALWIENMNTVLDDNKMLCLANSERIKLNDTIRMLFEVQDLAMASPATVSRCGMVFVDPEDLGWRPYVKTWLETKMSLLTEETRTYIFDLFESHFSRGMKQSKVYYQVMKQVGPGKLATLCSLMHALLINSEQVDMEQTILRLHTLIACVFAFSFVWSFAGNLNEAGMEKFETHARSQLEEVIDVKLPNQSDLFSVYVDLGTGRFELWEKALPRYLTYDRELPYFEILIPTVDSLRFTYLMENLVAANKPVLFTGESGVGKSVVVYSLLKKLSDEKNYLPVFMNFSAQTSSIRTQELIEAKLERRRSDCIGAPPGKQVILFADDLNMPKLDTYGSQPPIELLRQFVDFHGLYDREKLFWKEVADVTITAACAPPGGGRNPVTPRFLRHFAVFAMPPPSEHNLKTIFSTILTGFLIEFTPEVKEAALPIIDAAVEVYRRLSTDLLPTPAKSHYVFNLRDLSKCIQGMLRAESNIIRKKTQIHQLFFHEALRVFHDRLVNMEDKMYFYSLLSEVANKNLRTHIAAESFVDKPLVFGSYIEVGSSKENRSYKDYSECLDKVRAALEDYLDEYNTSSQKEMNLVFFQDAIEHISRIIRMIVTPRGNALLVGIGGCGKQSLTRLACFVCCYKCYQIELTRQYNHSSFHEDLKQLYTSAGMRGEDTVFLFTDTQIVSETFLEDINNILNSGEVPNLFDKDEFEQVLGGVRAIAKDHGVDDTDRDGVIRLFKTRVRENLHLVLCMSPVGDSFRSRCRMFPSIVNCCTIDWFVPWPPEALLSVSNYFFDKVTDLKQWEQEALSKICVTIHTSVDKMSVRYYNELRRHYYTTPTSYIGLINSYLEMLDKKRKELVLDRDKFQSGLTKLLKTYDLVDAMKEELAILEPELVKKTAETDELMKTIMVDQEKADRVCVVVAEDESAAAAKAHETQLIADDAQADLNKALPYLRSAIKALDALDKSDIAELKVFTNPPDLVMTVMETVCILLNSKTDWASAKILLGDSNFLKRLLEYDKDNVSQKTIKKLDRYIADPYFLPEHIEKVSKACKSMCMWVRAMHTYSNVLRVVEPKRQRYAAAKRELDLVQANLAEKQAHLKEVEDHIAQLRESYDQSMEDKDELAQSMQITTGRMRRAQQLTASLSDEQTRWKNKVDEFENRLDHAVGDVFIAAACVAYFGAFTSMYREELVTNWIESCKTLKLGTSKNLSLLQTFGNSYEIRQWNTEGLPRDSMSIENAILVTRSWRWPLMVDPQNQANRWVRNMEKTNGLKVIKLTTTNFLRSLENAIRLGLPVLIEDLGESLDPALEPILLKQTYQSSGRLLIRLGDTDIDYDEHFKLYMTTKLANPHYLPEVCIKVTLINFTVTKLGLEDQILSDVVRLERPDLEVRRNQLILNINSDKAQLKSLEDQILKLLFKSRGNILDNQELINTLDDSKSTASDISSRLELTQETESNISSAREKYRPVAVRGSSLYFVISSLSDIDPMYQFSLQYFNVIFNTTITGAKKSHNLEKRLKILMEETTYAVYRNVSRGLFERHKLIFSFMLCTDVLKQDNKMDDEWNFFLRGAAGVDRIYPPKPAHAKWLTEETWKKAIDLEQHLKCFKGLSHDLVKTPIYCALGELEVRLNPEAWEQYTDPEPPPYVESNPNQMVVGHWEERLTMFQKLLLVRFFMEEKLVSAVTDFVIANCGKCFVENPPVSIASLYDDMTKDTPLVFVLTTGSDPMGSFMRFANEQHSELNVEAISLGQGQGPIAEKLLKQARIKGGWVFLQNCHLARSFMPHLEDLFKELKEDSSTEVHDDFRLFLSSMPASFFPVSILQGSVKVTNEPPKGLRSNIRGAFSSMSASFFEDHFLGLKWRKMVFGICFFHAIIQERKKFGPLGWNISYEFNDSDRECALLNLDILCKTDQIPWDALVYITGEITYGGRVTDAIDQRCLTTTLLRFFDEHTLYEDYKYSQSGVYFAPSENTLAGYEGYVNRLPINDDPEIFGMHNNANLYYQKGESSCLISTILGIQPRVVVGGEGETNDNIVTKLASNILEKVSEVEFDMEKAEHHLFKLDSKNRLNSLTTVLQQEIERFNKLINVVITSLKILKKAIAGFVVMNEEMEAMYMNCINSKVPNAWEASAYPSLKPLGSWVKDLMLRCNFMRRWLERGKPGSFWISGFFFPQGFLTGVLQNHARKHDYPIDRLSFQFHPIPVYREQTSYDEESRNLKFQAKALSDSKLPSIAEGVFIHGLYTDAFHFDPVSLKMASEQDRVMRDLMTMLHIEPKMDFTASDFDYHCPLYKTAARAGVLSTTGHSTNFVIFVHLPTDQSPSFWISRGSALLCGLDD